MVLTDGIILVAGGEVVSAMFADRHRSLLFHISLLGDIYLHLNDVSS